LSGR
jgi:hypothetical protein